MSVPDNFKWSDYVWSVEDIKKYADGIDFSDANNPLFNQMSELFGEAFSKLDDIKEDMDNDAKIKKR